MSKEIKSSKLKRELNTKGENVEIMEKILGKGREIHNWDILIHHKISDTKSRVLIKAVLYDNSKLNFIGRIVIDKDCENCDAFLTLKVLLIGDEAKVSARPELEILNDNVKCSHAVSISRPNEKELEYIMSRGISWDKAVQMIAEGFMTKQ